MAPIVLREYLICSKYMTSITDKNPKLKRRSVLANRRSWASIERLDKIWTANKSDLVEDDFNDCSSFSSLIISYLRLVILL